MQANPGKFQAVVLGKRGHGDCESFRIHDNTVKCVDSVKLLGLTIDYMLNFDLHISDICKKALFDLILYVTSTIFQLYRDGSSWVEPVLS